uniref:Uncharacterized protein n=1 Tax=Lygus hesperus TaxID=30085 RepID=A0A0A9X5W7_LYGHE
MSVMATTILGNSENVDDGYIQQVSPHMKHNFAPAALTKVPVSIENDHSVSISYIIITFLLTASCRERRDYYENGDLSAMTCSVSKRICPSHSSPATSLVLATTVRLFTAVTATMSCRV